MKKKLPTPQRLPSGIYRCQVMVGGQRVSVTDPDEDKCQAKAVALQAGLIEQEKKPVNLTVSEAVARYVESKNVILSPSTIAGYDKIEKNLMRTISKTKLEDLTQEKIQRWVNSLAREKSPKTVANAHGLLSAVLAEYKPSMTLRTTLPQKIKHEVQIPSEGDVRAIMEAAAGTKYELPIMLAIWLGLRQSEILGLTWDCIDGETLYVRQAIVMGENGPVEKGTKTYSGTRSIHLPPYLSALIASYPHNGEHIINMSAKSVYSGFSRICEKAGVQHYRFHDLRHLNASAMLAVGVPDKYSMKRMGHATNNMLKTVYQHTIKEKEKQYDDAIENYFSNLMKPDK